MPRTASGPEPRLIQILEARLRPNMLAVLVDTQRRQAPDWLEDSIQLLLGVKLQKVALSVVVAHYLPPSQ